MFCSLNDLLIGKSLSPLFALCYAKRVSKETAKSPEEDADLCQSSRAKISGSMWAGAPSRPPSALCWSTTFCPGPGSFPSGKGSKARSRRAAKSECLTILDKTYIMKVRKVLSCKMASSLLANQRNDRSGWEVWGGHFLCQSSELCFVLGLSRKTSLAIIHVT